MGLTIVHEIKDEKNINILLTCPACLKSLIKENLITDGKEKKLLTYDKTKKLIRDRFENGEDSYEMVCPHCGRFHIIYVNRLQKIRNVTNDDDNLLEDNNVKKIE